jgi:hypothetical protein
MKKIITILLVIPFLFTSCEEALDEINALLTEFDATVSGFVTTSFSGEANFGQILKTSDDPESSILTIYLDNPEDSEEFITLTVSQENNGTGIVAGTYSPEATIGDQTVALVYQNEIAGFVIPDLTKTNELVLSSVENTRVKGSFNLNLLDGLGNAVAVSGTFNALGTTVTQ